MTVPYFPVYIVTGKSLAEKCQPSSESPLDPVVQKDLEFILERNLKEIIAKYASYVDSLRAAIEEKRVSPEALRAYLLSLSASSNGDEGEMLTLMSEKKSELQKLETIPDIFSFLTTECASFLNYEIFQNILKNYSIGDKDEDIMTTFRLMLKRIKSQRLLIFFLLFQSPKSAPQNSC